MKMKKIFLNWEGNTEIICGMSFMQKNEYLFPNDDSSLLPFHVDVWTETRNMS